MGILRRVLAVGRSTWSRSANVSEILCESINYHFLMGWVFVREDL